MAKQLNVSLNVSANTQQAQQSLQQLQMTLNTIANTPIKLNGATISKEMAIAKQSAQDLQKHLNNAFNTKTGNLDLSKLNASLTASGQNIGTLSANLLKAGNVGQTAFLNLQRSISQASVQINQANGLLTQFWTTLKNTARWQLSSSLLHGFMGSLQSAWGYAKDLDKSLNNIRIVTGYSAEKMSDFADQANKAAKALSTTTTDYTNASLIYFQQGLSDTEVIERTNVTVKMANVVGQSVETISDQLTAIWNNFDDGTKSLEYYADVITALGAATASSSDEIATGLEKFASIATTVGLSYEYATAALATVTAETRQSADVVGTAFKTLFARLQDLEVGETLDDGTTLGKYSAALASVGVNIKDASGELKDMDTILDELGSKWSTLSKDIQVAVAQTVAGTRQYSQLLALMSNWDVFQTNLKTIDTSEDTLTNQAAIYEDSWSAATKRVKAATEGIYNNLIPTDQLTDLADGFATFLEGIESVIEGMGGLKSILLLVSSIALSAFQHQLGGAIDNLLVKITSLGSNFKLNLGGSLSSIKSITTELSNITADSNFKTLANQFERIGVHASQASQYTHQMAIQGRNANASMSEYNTNLMQINNTQALIEQSNKYLTAAQKEQLAVLQQQAQIANEQLLTAREQQSSAQSNLNVALSVEGDELEHTDRFRAKNKNNTIFTSSASAHDAKSLENTLKILRDQNNIYDNINVNLSKNRQNIELSYHNTKDLVQVNRQAKKDYADIYEANRQIQQIRQRGLSENEEKKQIQGIIAQLKQKNAAAAQYVQTQTKGKKTSQDIAQAVDKATTNMRVLIRATGSSSQQAEGLEQGMQKAGQATDILRNKMESYKQAIAQVTSTLQNGLVKAMSAGNVAAGMMSGFSKVAMGINAVNNAINTLKNDDADWVAKLTSGAMAATMGFQGLMTVMGGLNNVFNSFKTSATISALATDALSFSTEGLTKKQRKQAKAAFIDNLATKLGIETDVAAALAEELLAKAKDGGTKATMKDTIANYANVASQMAKYWWITLIIAALALLVAGTIAAIEADKKEEAQLKKSTAAAKEAAEEFDAISQKADNIKSAFEEYDTVVEKLNECTKGTKEWREALENVSAQVQKIMDEHPELVTKYADAFYRDASTGIMMINEDSKEQIIQDYNNATLAASFNKSTTAAQVLKDQAAYDLKDDIKNSGLAYTTQEQLRERARKGERIENLQDDQDFIRQAANALIAQNSNENYIMPYEVASAQVVEALNELETPLQEYTKSVDKASESLLTAAQLIADKAIPDASAEVKNIVSADLAAQEKAYKDAYLGLMTNIRNDSGEYATLLGISQSDYNSDISKTSGTDNFIYEKILKDLQTYVDSGFSAWTDNAVQGRDGNRYLVFTDSQGNEWKKSADYIATKLASAKALAKITDSTTKAQEILSTIEANVKEINSSNADGEVNAINTFIGYQNFDSVKQSDFNTLYNRVAGDDGEVTADESENYLKQIFDKNDGEELTEEEAAYFGYSSVEALVTGFTNGLKSGKLVADSASAFNSFFGDVANSLTLTDLGNLTSIFNKINLGPAGKQAGETFMTGLNTMIDGLSDAEKIEALQALTAIDWTAYDAIDQAAMIMEKYGKTIDSTSGYWRDFADEMRIAVHATPDFSALRDNLTAVNKILKDLDFGSIIEDEDYQTLIKYNAAWEKFFIMQADGTRKFIGNSNNMQRATRDIVIAGRKEMEELGALVNTITTNGEKYTMADEDTLNNITTADLRTYLLNQGMNADAINELADSKDPLKNIKTVALGYAKANYAEDEIFSQEGVKALLSAKDYTDEDIANIIQEAKEGNTARLNDIFNMLNDTMGQDYTTLTSNYEEMVASTATSVMDLDSLLKAGEISENTYKKALLGLASGYEECRDELEEYNEVMADANSTAEEKIAAEKKLKKALTDSAWKKLTKDIKKYNEELKKLSDTEDIAKKYKEMADAINAAFGTNVSSTFIANNKELIDEWMNSTGNKATELGLKIQSLAVMQSTAATSIIDATVNGVSRTSDAINSAWLNMKSVIEENPITIKANGHADLTQLMDALIAADYTAQEIANFLASIGQTDITLAGWVNGKDVNLDLSNPEDLATFVQNFKGGVKVTSASVPSKGIADMNSYKGSGGGGGGDKKKTKKSDVVERYKEINDELDETARKMNKASSLADTLWGDARFDKIQEGIDLLKEENAELERKAELQQQYLAEDRTALDAAAAAAGVSFTYGADGNITNYTSEMERLYAQLKAAEDSGNTSEVERLTKLIEDLDNARKQYEETLQEGYDIDEKRLENQIKIWAENFKKITEKLELEIKINDQDLAILEYYLKKVEGNAFQAAESFALLVDQQKEHTENLAAYRKAYEEAKIAYEKGEISEAEYKEAIEQAQQGILDELSALQDLQKQMEDYYGNTIAMAQEEMAAFIEQMEHSTSVLDHYSSILDIIGKQQDYATKGTVLKGRADSLRNELETQRKLYEDYSKDADEYYAKMMAAEVGSNEYLYYKKQWEVAQNAANEAQENMLAKTEEWAEAMKAVVENELEGLAKTLEEAMTGGTNFDTMLTSMERASSLQEEYLTTTNKIYETNKLMRTAQQEIDKTTNSVAKRRLSQFIKETEQLQSQNKLSQYELDIQQAKYDLLLAEIALEEAQNAKSTVRLQRDSEGNFGYVYTADSSAIAEAEQQLADAQNSLYNIGLEGANDYGQKYAETMSEMYDTLKELQTQYLEGAFDNEEEYNNAVAEAKKYYYEKLEQYSSLYSVALTTDSRVVADAWSTDFNEMIYKTDEWKAKVDEYTAEAAQTLGEWQQTVADILAETGLDDTAAAVKDVTDKSKELATFLNGEGGLIDVLSKERDEVKLVIDQNKDWATSVAAITKEYEDLLKQLQLDYKAPSQGNNNGEEGGSGGENSGGGSGSGDGNRESGNPGGDLPEAGNPCGICGNDPCTCDKKKKELPPGTYSHRENGAWKTPPEATPIDAANSANNPNTMIYAISYNTPKDLINGVVASTPIGTRKDILGFDTGGYTGSWGSYGKMAMLHEKELVLNAHDTENFLASMELLNRIIEVINLHSASAQLYGLSMTPGRMAGFDNGTLEQHVTIEANFPSVQDRNEIEEAFTNLINQASQYANRTQY